MTITIKKVRNYALLGTIISANATAPAQAHSLQQDLTKTLHTQVSAGIKDAFSEIKLPSNPDSCMSFPELYLCNQFKKDDNQNSLENLLLQEAQEAMKSIENGENIQIKTPRNGVPHIIYDAKLTSLQSQEQSSLYTYTTVWRSGVAQRKKVPEPSALLGLIAFCFFAAKSRTAKS